MNEHSARGGDELPEGRRLVVASPGQGRFQSLWRWMQGAVRDPTVLVDELKAAGIEPFATLYHWDLPQALQDEYGGWQSAETAKAFGEYGATVAKHLSDRVGYFFTINEFNQVTATGHGGVELNVQGKTVRLHIAPGLTLAEGPLNQVRHHTMYLRNGMMWQQRATAEGIPLKGSFYWSAMDNLEWTAGFGTRFGLVYVNFKTQQRIPKLSAQWFREAAAHNAVV